MRGQGGAAKVRPSRRPPLSVAFSGERLVSDGVALGVAFALSFHLAFLSVTHGARPIFEDGPARFVERMSDPANARLGRDVPVLVGPAEASAPRWVEPFWAGLSAALGQCVAVAVWLAGATPPRPTAHRRRLRYARAQSLVWVGLAPLVFVKLGELYVALPYSDAIWTSALGNPPFADPLKGLGGAALLAVLFLALEPWRGLVLAYRCGRWPMLGVASVRLAAAVLYAVGRLAFGGVG